MKNGDIRPYVVGNTGCHVIRSFVSWQTRQRIVYCRFIVFDHTQYLIVLIHVEIANYRHMKHIRCRDMESSACVSRASDAEQPARSYSVAAECEPAMVKEEPEWGECGVSEAAAAGGLYAGHEVKDELVIGPELIQQQDIAFPMQNIRSRMAEGPCKLKAEGGADAAPGCTHTCPGDGPGCNRSTEHQHGLRSCYVRLERLPVGDRHSYSYILSRADEAACKLQPAGEAGPATESTRAQADHTTREHTHTGQKPHSCDVCHKRFRQRGHLVDHLRIHTGEKPFICSICQKQYTRRVYVIQHFRTHTGEKPYGCDVCNKRFTQRAYLISHKRIHTGEKPYVCDICNKRFTRRNSLTSHMRRHTGETPFGCDICNKRFARRSNLTSHIQIHAGKKPYSCDICNERFTRRHNLTSHMRTHAGETPFGCDICNKRFTRRSNLISHIQIHSGKKPSSCDICNKHFTRRHNLTSHMRKHAGETQPRI